MPPPESVTATAPYMPQQAECPPLNRHLELALAGLCATSNTDRVALIDWGDSFWLSPNSGVLSRGRTKHSAEPIAAAHWPGTRDRQPGAGIYLWVLSEAVDEDGPTGETLQVAPTWAPEADAYLADRGWRLQPVPVPMDDGESSRWLPPQSVCEKCLNFLACSLQSL